MIESKEKPDLKLYVVGESSGNPDEWSDYPVGRKLVLAASADEAVVIADGGTQVALVESDGPVVLSESSVALSGSHFG